MEPPSVIYPPNRPLERLLKPSQVPVLYDYVLQIDINQKGETAVLSTNLSDCYWESTVLHYKNVENAGDEEKYCGFFITTSLADIKHLPESNLLVAAEDNGHLKLLSTTTNESKAMKCEDIYNCTYPVKRIAMWNFSHKILTCGDKSVSIWDVENNYFLSFIRDFKDYHLDAVTSVDCNKSHVNLFTSASLDRKVCIWDDRIEIPASYIYENEFCNLKSIAWKPMDSSYITVGAESGDVYLLDTRQPKETVNSLHCFDGAVHQTVYSRSGRLSVCGNSTKTLVLNSNFDVIYNEDKHKAFVRGLAWYNESLYACGFDRQILKHDV